MVKVSVVIPVFYSEYFVNNALQYSKCFSDLGKCYLITGEYQKAGAYSRLASCYHLLYMRNFGWWWLSVLPGVRGLYFSFKGAASLRDRNL